MDQGVKAYGLVDNPMMPIFSAIAERAYYKWLNGSDDTHKNWCDAEYDAITEEIFKFRGLYD